MQSQDSWIITLPQQIEWSDYEKELQAAERGAILNFRIPRHIRSVLPGGKCYITWRGQVRGYHIIKGVSYFAREWQCSTSTRVWPPGLYIQRTGRFFKVQPRDYKGFQGIRKFDPITQNI